jgi:hypothetical protein
MDEVVPDVVGGNALREEGETGETQKFHLCLTLLRTRGQKFYTIFSASGAS